MRSGPVSDLFTLLQTPGLKLGRTDPNIDPQGRDFIYMLQLAQMYYHLPSDTVSKILGTTDWGTANSPQIYADICDAAGDGPGLRTAVCPGPTASPSSEELSSLASVLGIENLLSAMPARLSGGQAHRVALGRLLLAQCDTLLLDERTQAWTPACAGRSPT